MTKQGSYYRCCNTGSYISFIIAKHELADVVLIDRPKMKDRLKVKHWIYYRVVQFMALM